MEYLDDSTNKVMSNVIIQSIMKNKTHISTAEKLEVVRYALLAMDLGFFVPLTSTNMGYALLAMDLGFLGPTYSISAACATSNYCVHAAANHIREGKADLMIAGGVEALLVPLGIGGFSACKTLSQRNDDPRTASRPWDKDRDGFVMGEGAGDLCYK